MLYVKLYLIRTGERRSGSEFTCCCCSVAQLCPALCDPVDCSSPGFPVPHYLPELAQTHVRRVDDAIQPSHPLSPLLLLTCLSQHQYLFQRVGSSHQVAKVCVCCVCVLNAPHHMAHRVLFPWLGIEPVPLAVKAQSPNHWTTREFLSFFFLVKV